MKAVTKNQKLSQSPLGSFVRACRLGFRISKKHQAFIRLERGKTEQQLIVTVAPLDVKVEGSSKNLHLAWWESPAILETILPLRNIKNPKKAFSFAVDIETGELVETSTTKKEQING